MSSPRRFQFMHGGIAYDAVLVEGNASSAATGECCICRQSLRGLPHYVTNPALLHLHKDCALRQPQQQPQPQPQQQQRSGTTRSLRYPLHNTYVTMAGYPQQSHAMNHIVHGSSYQQHYPPTPYTPRPYHSSNIYPPIPAAGSSSAIAGAFGTVALGAFLQALFGSMLDGMMQ